MLIVEQLELAGRLPKTSFTLDQGHLLALFGNNGAGKSTLLKLLAGLWKPDVGKVRWKGVDLEEVERWKRSQIVTYIPQNGAPPFPYCVEEFVQMGSYFSKMPVEEVLDRCCLGNLKGRSMLAISQGERQRAYIARGLACGAELLLFDEPTAHLDRENCSIVWDLIQDLVKSGRTVVVATHDQEAITPISTDVLHLRRILC